MVHSEPTGPDQAAVHNRFPEVASHCGSLDFGISAPGTPVDIPSHPKGVIINSSQGMS